MFDYLMNTFPQWGFNGSTILISKTQKQYLTGAAKRKAG